MVIDETLPATVVDAPAGYENLWGRTKEALREIFTRYGGQFDWIYKADDDT